MAKARNPNPEIALEDCELAARRVQNYLRRHRNPYCTVIIDSESIKIVSTELYLPREENTHCDE